MSCVANLRKSALGSQSTEIEDSTAFALACSIPAQRLPSPRYKLHVYFRETVPFNACDWCINCDILYHYPILKAKGRWVDGRVMHDFQLTHLAKSQAAVNSESRFGPWLHLYQRSQLQVASYSHLSKIPKEIQVTIHKTCIYHDLGGAFDHGLKYD